MLAFQLALTRVFAVAQFYHFAFMVISLAMLGSGAAGSVLSAWPGLRRHPTWWSVGFALTAAATLAILNRVPFDSYAIAWDRRQLLYLLLYFASAAVPFLFTGLTIGGLLAANAQSLHLVYGANLVGSALGCLAALPLVDWLGGEGALLASAAMGLLAAGLLGAPGQKVWAGARAMGLLSGAGLLLTLAIVRPEWVALRLSPYKALTQTLLAPGARHTLLQWGISARVDVVESDSIHVMPGLSQNALFSRPPLQAGLILDGGNLTPLTALAPDDDLARTLAANVPEAIAHQMRPNATSLLVLEPAGGWSVLMALANGAPRVTVLERNPLVAGILQGQYASFTRGLYHDPRVRVNVVEARTYMRQPAELYDLIVVALSDTFHPVTSGAYSLGEEYRYTVEALGDYLDRLSPGGMLVVTRWLQTPPTECLRILASLEAALRARGVARPGEQIAAFRSLRTMTLVATLEPLTSDDQAAIRSFVASRGYDLVWLLSISPDEVNLRNRLPTPIYYNAFAALLDDPAGFIRSYEYDIRPARDDRPFFFHYFRWRQTPQILSELGQTWQPFGGSGYLVLLALLALVAFLAMALIFGPLLLRPAAERAIGGRWGPRCRALIYFLMLGLGFMFVEIPLAQRFILFVGQPVTALAVVLFAILLFSGLGSLSAPRWQLRVALPALIGVALLTPLLLRALFALALGQPLAVRVLLSVASLAPLGLLMGIPFARGLALYEQTMPTIIPWAWAVNGSASVVSSVLAVMIALSWGFSAVLWLGAGAYALALVAVGPLAATGPAPRG
jgi:hypothetical protein